MGRRERRGAHDRDPADGAGGGTGPGTGTLEAAGSTGATAHDRKPRRSAGATLVALGSLVGLLAALLAGFLAGGDGPALVGGAIGGLVVGFVVGLLAARLTRLRPTPAQPSEASGTPKVAAARASSVAAAPRAGVGAADDDNLGPLLTSVGHRYQLLTDRQLVALAARSPTGAAGGADAGVGSGPGADAGVGAGRGAGAGADASAHTTGARREDDALGAARLARRMRRLSKTLQVLADDPTSWEAAAPATISEVVAAAVADIDPLAPVDSRSLHPASIEGEAVPDVVHLLAELIENTVTASASTSSRVVVLGRRSAEGYVVSVVDEGAGMADVQRDRANAQLHAPPPLPRQPPSSLGLATAGRLAARHGIGVTLLEAPTDGVIAKVRLPIRLLGGAPPDRGASGRPRSRSVIDLTDDEPSPTIARRSGPGDGAGGRTREGTGSGASAPAWTTSGGPFERSSAGTGGGSRGPEGVQRDTADSHDPDGPCPERPTGTRSQRDEAEGGSGTQRSNPVLSGRRARADLARRVQGSRPVPREVAAVRQEQRAAEPGSAAGQPTGGNPRPAGDTAERRTVERSGDPSADTPS